MQEFEKIFCDNFEAFLRERIRGSVRVKIDPNGILLVSIYKDNFDFRYTLADVSDRLYRNYISKEKIAEEIIAKYKSALLKKYFK